MKKYLFIILVFFVYCLSFGQKNVVQNLSWRHWYTYPEQPYNQFILEWDEPEQPHDELIGYNIYRGDELYKFQTKTSIGCVSNPMGQENECEFLGVESFTGYVAAVYKDGTESAYVQFVSNGPLLNTKEVLLKSTAVFPNPVKNLLNFSQEVNNLTITDVSGKLIKQITINNKSVDLSQLSKGIYIITALKKNGEIINQKIIKE